MQGTFNFITNCFYFITVISTLFGTASGAFLQINLSAVALFVLGEILNCSNSSS